MKMPRPDFSLQVACPICGAPAMSPCLTTVGTLRNQSHLYRVDIAKERLLQNAPAR